MQSEQQSYAQAIKRIGDLHGNMAVLSKLDTVLKDYNSSLEDAEQLVQSDGAIAATIVKLSNSALYGFGEGDNDLSSALQKVGFAETLKLVSMALSKQVFMRDLDAYGVSADSYWRYSYFVAVFMEGQAKRVGLDVSDAYLLGLLHSIGRVVITELLHADEVEVYWDRFVSESVWETSMVGFTNRVAGSLLLKSWNFTEEIYQRVEQQSDPELQAADPVLALLDYARQLALHLEDASRIEELCQPEAHPYLALCEQSESELLASIATAQADLEETYESLRKC